MFRSGGQSDTKPQMFSSGVCLELIYLLRLSRPFPVRVLNKEPMEWKLDTLPLVNCTCIHSKRTMDTSTRKINILYVNTSRTIPDAIVQLKDKSILALGQLQHSRRICFQPSRQNASITQTLMSTHPAI
ncbi:hypothetical protein TNCV_3583621 [Trichonephila clavipes]|nr:hypothetical protein TNCV_3583621 [Trichonephila clavipes]